MKINLNNREATFEVTDLTIAEVISTCNFTYKRLVVRLNGKVVRSEDHEITRVNDGDKLEVIHLMAGG
ncbi:MAG: thiamine biosynthesis protein ThiS [Bacteroidetes bacterium GWE2_42_24]|nr:MAG: thiamine biosynthesis protein ThiS [Bacteroidetes bacterium GWE2_42_24]OFY29079.1 MAG: thiamine biosynthesis protein ThiS [Bacteroidetes bacterium GWF2_43_11]PKP19115.1 MAG: thiamine biosynthesis protein ThiS [Bacteroidetes bacterium HGW-Bacteroidetes-22]